MSITRKIIVIIGLSLALFFPKFTQDASAQVSIDFAAFGVGFACVGDNSVGNLFDTGVARCDPDGTQNLFSNAACTYENIIDQILGRLYCGMQFRLLEPLSALMLLFITFIGIAFALGILPFTARETVLVLFKFGLVYYFATDSYLTIDILYTGLMYFIQDSVIAVMANVAPSVGTLSGPDGLFDRMDEIIAEFARNAAVSQDPNAPCTDGLVAMFMTFIGSVPMLAMFGIGMAFQFVMIFFQMILGYFIAITGIMFLIALAPFFLSFALFKFTRGYFDQWVGYLTSFCVQVFVVMGFIGVMISLNLDEDLRQLFDLAQPYTVVQQVEGVRVPYRDWCTICTPESFGRFGMTCADGAPLHPQTILSNPNTIREFGTRLFKILVLAYILKAAMNAVPKAAQAIGASRHAPAIAGGVDEFNAIRYPGMGAAKNATTRFVQSGNVADGMRGIFSPLVSGRK